MMREMDPALVSRSRNAGIAFGVGVMLAVAGDVLYASRGEEPPFDWRLELLGGFMLWLVTGSIITSGTRRRLERHGASWQRRMLGYFALAGCALGVGLLAVHAAIDPDFHAPYHLPAPSSQSNEWLVTVEWVVSILVALALPPLLLRRR